MTNDLISRQKAIDALAKHEKSNGHNYTLFVDIVSECAEIIRDLPSAQPERKTGLVDRKEVIKAFTEMDHMGLGERDIIHEFETMPSADAVEVVRCKDCRWKLWTQCTRFEYLPVTDEDFCSKGERRTDDCN